MKLQPNKKNGIKVVQPWQVGATDNFHGFDTGNDTDIEPAPSDEPQSEDSKPDD